MNVFTWKFRLPRYLQAALFLILPSAFFLSAPAYAGVEEDIARVEAVTTLLQGIVTAMVEVVVAPLGISAAAKTFRHVILANV